MITISKTQRLISTRLASKRLLSLRDGGRSAQKLYWENGSRS